MSICPQHIQTHDNVSHIPKDPILLYLSTRETCIRIAPLSIQQIQSTSKDIQKKIPEKRIFSQHVPSGTLDSMAVHRRIITNTMNRKSCRAFFCPLDRSYSHSFFLLLLSSFNHPSFSCGGINRFSRSSDRSTDSVRGRTPCLDSQVGVGRRWLLSVVPVHR